jgi:hypothetical protein
MANWTNTTSWTGILQTANTNTEGYFWVMILWAVWIISLIILSIFGLYPALLTASFIGLIFGTILAYGGLVAWPWVLVYFATILIVILMISWTGSRR